MDTIGENPDSTNSVGTGGFHAIVGNPPFLSQLSSATSLDRGCAAIIKQRLGKAASAYTDTSMLFLADALSRLAPSGRVSFLLPQSFLASRDAARIRSMIRACHTLEHLWVSGEHAFEQAFVSACAPVVHRTHSTDTVCTTSYSLAFSANGLPSSFDAEPGSGTWSFLAADARGLPKVSYHSRAMVGAIATATADFRDEYYGLAGYIVDKKQADDMLFPRLITTRMIDPAHNCWGLRASRVLKESWQSPRIDRDRMRESGTLSDWIDARLVPKVLIATQSNVIEAIVDNDGDCLPCMPVITAFPKNGVSLWHLASALSSPIACQHAVRHYSGTAMTPDAIKLSAKQVLTLPIPVPCASWDRAADRYRAASDCVTTDERLEHLTAGGSEMCSAFRMKVTERDGLLGWWQTRLAKTLLKS